MGVRAIESNGLAVIFCSTTDVAFGPVFYGGIEQAERFLEYLPKDARRYAVKDLLDLYCEWRAEDDKLQELLDNQDAHEAVADGVLRDIAE